MLLCWSLWLQSKERQERRRALQREREERREESRWQLKIRTRGAESKEEREESDTRARPEQKQQTTHSSDESRVQRVERPQGGRLVVPRSPLQEERLEQRDNEASASAREQE
jgi:hypothetical protein